MTDNSFYINKIAQETNMVAISRHIWLVCCRKIQDRALRQQAYENIMISLFSELLPPIPGSRGAGTAPDRRSDFPDF